MNYSFRKDISRRIFYIVLLFFLFLELYGVYHVELRMCFESAFEIIRTQADGMSAPFYRYSFLLNKFLLKPAFALHLPVRTIAYTLCLNDLLFYLSVALIIIAFTRQYLYAAVVLAAPVLIHGHFYYFMVNEIFLSGAMMILFIAVYHHMYDGSIKTLIMSVSIFFVIWGHPFTIYLTILFLITLYQNKDQLRKDWLIILFIIINLAGRLTHWSSYDLERVNDHIQPLSGLGISIGDIIMRPISTFISYSISYWFIILLLIVMFKTAGSSSDKRNARIALASLLFTLLLQTILYYDKDADGDSLAKIAYSTHLFILFYGSVACLKLWHKKNRQILTLTLVALSLGLWHILFSEFREKMDKHIAIFEKANYAAAHQSPPHSKWYIRLNKIAPNDVMMNPFFFSESFTFSAMTGQKPLIHVVFASDSIIDLLKNTKDDEICFAYNLTYHSDRIDHSYYPLLPGPYKELIIDSAGFANMK